jgi:hypothetical protein
MVVGDVEAMAQKAAIAVLIFTHETRGRFCGIQEALPPGPRVKREKKKGHKR